MKCPECGGFVSRRELKSGMQSCCGGDFEKHAKDARVAEIVYLDEARRVRRAKATELFDQDAR